MSLKVLTRSIMVCARLRFFSILASSFLFLDKPDETLASRPCYVRPPRLCKQPVCSLPWARRRHDGVSKIEAQARRKRRCVRRRECPQSSLLSTKEATTSKMQSSHKHLRDVKSTRSSNGRVKCSSSRGSGTRSGSIDQTVTGNKLQSVDFTTTLLLTRELQRTITPSRMETVYQLGPHDVAISLRTLSGSIWLRISWNPKGARCHVGAPPPREKEQKAYTFSQTLRALLRGLNIVAVGLARPFERVIYLDFASRLDTPPKFRLYVEIMASRSNVILAAKEEGVQETVAACAYQVSPTKSVRPLSTGQLYELPPALTARRPSLEESLEDFTERVGRVPTQQLKKALVSVYQGMSPMLVSVMASRVPGLTPVMKVGDIAPEQWQLLHSGPWRRWLQLVGDGSATRVARNNGAAGSDSSADARAMATPWIAEDGSSYYPTTLAENFCSIGGGEVGERSPGLGIGDGSEDGPAMSLQAMLETYYGATQSSAEFDNLKRRCTARVTATLAKLRERVKDFEGQLAAAQEDKVSELNRRGDLLVTFAHVWRDGDPCVECEDFETGERILIEINPDKTPVETAQEAYKLGKKLKRSATFVRDLLDQTKAQVLYAEGIEVALEQLLGGNETGAQSSASREELSVLRGIAEELGILGGADAQRKFAAAFGVKQVQSGRGGGATASDGRGGRGGSKDKRSGGRGKKSGGVGTGTGKRESQTAGLLELRRVAGTPPVLVGRNNLQNERITFSVGQAHELWFHARGVAGAHVLLRLDPGRDADDDDLAFAADVAVYFSKARQSTSTAVDYISPKAVKKLGSAGPGMVKYEGAKVLRGVPGRVEALVAEAIRSREDLAS